ncbi:hypothetical protein HYZ97_02840 [Candidatus Pacearchaeota archaeon]|nr:hypothetical protein [Candidatus Pacearchaeota archaeon]
MNKKTIAQAVAALVLGGAALGIGKAVFDAGKDPIIKIKVEQLEEERGKLANERTALTNEMQQILAQQSQTLSNEFAEKFLAASNQFVAELKAKDAQAERRYIQVKEIYDTKEAALSNQFSAREQELTALKDGLERKFISQFPSIFQPITNNSTLTELERELYAGIHIGDSLYRELSQEPARCYDQTITNNMRLEASLVDKQDGTFFLIKRMDDSGMMLSADLFTSKGRSNLPDKITNSQPVKKIRFKEGTAVLVIDYARKESMQFEDGRLVYRNGSAELMSAQEEAAAKILTEFHIVYNRGVQPSPVKRER